MKNSDSESYAAAGVDVTAGYESVERIKPMVESTYIPGVMGTLGGFGGLGVYMTRVKKAYAFDKMFAVIILISVISLALMALVELAERRCMPYRHLREKS